MYFTYEEYIYIYIAECYTECLTNNVVGGKKRAMDLRSLEGHLASRNHTWLENPLSLMMFLAINHYTHIYIY